MTSRTYYGFDYRYGAKIRYENRDGGTTYVGTLHTFASRAARDAWVADSPTGYVCNPNYRDTVTRAWAIKNGNLARSGEDKFRRLEIEYSVVDHRYD